MQSDAADLNAVIGETLVLFAQLIGDDIAITPRLQPNLPRVHGAHGPLREVIVNLCVNARDAMPTGGTVVIRTTQVDAGDASVELAPEPCVLLEISDSGIGMDDAVQARAFEPSFTTKQGCAGLGLTTTAAIVEGVGGRIWLESEAGVGTTARVRFRSLEEKAPLDVLRSFEARATSIQTILLVEDSDELREPIRQLLELDGYTVLVASDAKAALTIASAHNGPISLLLADLRLPDVDGLMLAAVLGKAHPGLKQILMSGLPPASFPLSGDATFIQKPFDYEQLLWHVRAALD